jgi:hypothetical protein
VEVTLLRPLDWLSAQDATPGSVIYLDLPELNTAGPMQVESIAPAPPVLPGPGGLVTGTFRHVAPEVVQVEVQGLDELIRCAPRHPFWSITRQDWLAGCDLQPNETLASSTGGLVQVLSVNLEKAEEPVYNIEVDGEHVYRVSPLGVLVHNASWAHINRVANEFDDYVNSTFYGGIPATKPHFRTTKGARYLDNVVDDGFDRIGVENKYFRHKNGTVDTGVVRNTKKRAKLAETLKRIRRQAQKDHELLLSPDATTPTRIEWNLNAQYPKLEGWLRSLGLDVNIRPMP